MRKKITVFVSALMLTQSLNCLTPQKAAAAGVTFTHKEWTGQSGAEDVFAVNREAASVNPIPFQDDASASFWGTGCRFLNHSPETGGWFLLQNVKRET
jgi:beta-galactosidase